MSRSKPDRRLLILQTAVKLLSDKGIIGLTHRAIDAEASIPQGSTTYYYPKKNDLLRAAAEHLAQELEKDCDALQISFADLAARNGIDAAIDHVAKQLITTVDEARDLFLARIELTLIASRDQELTDIATRLSKAGRRPIEFFIGLITNSTDTTAINTCVGLLDGITLAYTTGHTGTTPTTDQIVSVIKTIVT
ncbi:TetR/AcrR family transcriptional regulator [Hirschia baltica]|uniref:Transcriptional regulator, TetR family n=1 Tax=Hirschia baltica (strain ATCC 49814 / DSM 5838 / IFAM 1418) TaxID=582402 RepID=C6XMQ2_HIRBI|nr:TetR family transcriptional regulator [Hirschia baltica]ACT59966.1 transcriptional regulator, TetR family [Hirschia baltica ATCC 49814]